uniref:Uncharacterized protein n=1 Tax=Triticum urartu TaxID=4572 RepID=A0A8R7THB5_TRIUA
MLTATQTRRLWPRPPCSLRSSPSRELTSTLASPPFLFVFLTDSQLLDQSCSSAPAGWLSLFNCLIWLSLSYLNCKGTNLCQQGRKCHY